MDENYKELYSMQDQRILPWKTVSLPRFSNTSQRKLDGYQNTKDQANQGEPPAPPPSPRIGNTKYAALFRESNSWLRATSIDSILADLRENGKHDVTKTSTTLRNRRTKKRRTLSNGEEVVVNALIISDPQGSANSYEAKDLNKDLNVEKEPDEKCVFKTEPMRNPLGIFESTEDFQVILSHAISHGRVMLEENFKKPIDRRSMIFA